MSKLLLVFSAFCAGALGFGALHRTEEQTRIATAAQTHEWTAATHHLAETKERLAALRSEVLDKKDRLRQLSLHLNISPEMLLLLEGDSSKAHPAAWAELRQQLGIGWDSSPDYVLVSKRVLKELDYPQLLSALRATDMACDLLAISPGEQSGIRAALAHARDAQWLRMERGQPSGDIVAQYTIPTPDPAFEQSVSNNFCAEVIGVLGAERADLFVAGAWREFKSGLAPQDPVTMTIRRTVVDGEPDLVCEIRRGQSVSTNPVRYAHYPSMWFLTLFPGGWKTLAEREGFDLPKKFQP